MTRKSKREIERALGSLREDPGTHLRKVVEREAAEDADWLILKPAGGSNSGHANKFREPPAPDDGEDLVEALVPSTALKSSFAPTDQGKA